MRARVIRPFGFSRDGVTREEAAIGDDVDVPGDLAPGLIAEGWISETPPEPEPEPESEEALPRRRGARADRAVIPPSP